MATTHFTAPLTHMLKQAHPPSTHSFSFPWKHPQTRPGALSSPTHEGTSIPNLFQFLTIKELTLKNRIVVSPMCQYSSKDGFYNDWHLVSLGGYAVGGAGLVFTEATAVEPIGRISPFCGGIWQDEHIVPLQIITNFLHQHHAAAGIQLAHSGRKGSTQTPWSSGEDKMRVPVSEGGWITQGPSPFPFEPQMTTPTEMNKDDIQRVILKFAEAAERALKANFDVLEIHAAHGYLIHQFLSPLTNHRKDEYGGNFEGRKKLCVDLVTAVRQVWPLSKPLFVRLSCTDWVPGGWDLPETIQLTKILKQIGVDLIDCSTGGNDPRQQIQAKPGFQVPFSRAIRSEVSVKTGAVGLITESKQAEEILQRGDADLIFMARELIRNPQWPLKAAIELGVDVEWACQNLRAKRKPKTTTTTTTKSKL